MDMISLQHTTSTNGFDYITLKPPKRLHPIIYKKLCFFWKSKPRPDVKSFKSWPIEQRFHTQNLSTNHLLNKVLIYKRKNIFFINYISLIWKNNKFLALPFLKNFSHGMWNYTDYHFFIEDNVGESVCNSVYKVLSIYLYY